MASFLAPPQSRPQAMPVDIIGTPGFIAVHNRKDADEGATFLVAPADDDYLHVSGFKANSTSEIAGGAGILSSEAAIQSASLCTAAAGLGAVEDPTFVFGTKTGEVRLLQYFDNADGTAEMEVVPGIVHLKEEVVSIANDAASSSSALVSSISGGLSMVDLDKRERLTTAMPTTLPAGCAGVPIRNLTPIEGTGTFVGSLFHTTVMIDPRTPQLVSNVWRGRQGDAISSVGSLGGVIVAGTQSGSVDLFDMRGSSREPLGSDSVSECAISGINVSDPSLFFTTGFDGQLCSWQRSAVASDRFPFTPRLVYPSPAPGEQESGIRTPLSAIALGKGILCAADTAGSLTFISL